ncbi:MAG TPA: SET domain-containing protein [Flavipsychrobacter sp.]|nr:SET domain-containing protein [Flavipsychrobacter sp.]
MIHPSTELKFISPEKGFGVVATKLIPKGTITWIMDPLDQIFSSNDIKKLDPFFQDLLATYSYRDGNGDFILCWDNARFVNHSFHSNCISTAYNFELAVRDIKVGEELTDDYGYLNITEPFECLPEPNTTRKKVFPDDLLHYHSEWDSQLIEAFKYFDKVPQVFLKYIDKRYSEKVKRVAAGHAEMDSILNLYYKGAQKVLAAH